MATVTGPEPSCLIRCLPRRSLRVAPWPPAAPGSGGGGGEALSGGRDGVLRAGTAVDVVDVPEDVGGFPGLFLPGGAVSPGGG